MPFVAPLDPEPTAPYRWGTTAIIWLGLAMAIATLLMCTVGVCYDTRKKLQRHEKKAKKLLKRVEKE